MNPPEPMELKVRKSSITMYVVAENTLQNCGAGGRIWEDRKRDSVIQEVLFHIGDIRIIVFVIKF